MRILKAVLVDDEAAANKVLASLLAAYEDIEIVGQYTDPDQALEAMDGLDPDVVFLDIEMGRINGIELANRLTRERYIQIIFITAFSDYAVDAFEVNAIDYLLKPVQKNRLDKAIRKIRGVQLQGKGESPVDPEPGKALHVISLDYPAVYNQNDRILAWRTRKAKELFFYLWLNRQTQVNKRTLIDRLFPDKDRTRAQVLLHTTVYQIRRSLADIGFPEGILFANDSYRLQVPVTADVNELEDVLERGGSDPDRIAAILDLYKSDFLREESYDWAMETRQLLKHKTYLALASFAEKRLETRDYTDPLDACLERIHQLNPAEERTARLFLKYFGDRQRMVKLKLYYADYKRRLMQDYAMKPQPSLEELYLSLTRR